MKDTKTKVYIKRDNHNILKDKKKIAPCDFKTWNKSPEKPCFLCTVVVLMEYDDVILCSSVNFKVSK